MNVEYPLLLRRKRVMELTGLSKGALHALVRENRIETVRIGKQRMYKRDSVFAVFGNHAKAKLIRR